VYLISKHKHLKIIGFNDLKSESLYDKYFIRKPDIQYIVLPSSSPANASTSFEQKCKVWSQLIPNK
jgi:G:T/U-mismatch repair DNA glycosylase